MRLCRRRTLRLANTMTFLPVKSSADMYGTRPLKIVRGPSGSPMSISSMYCVCRYEENHPSVVVSSKHEKRAAKSRRASTSIKSNNHPTRTNLSASSCFFALNTLPTRKSTRCSSGANSAGLPSARTTLLRARLSVDVIGVIHRCAAAPPRAMTPHRAVSDASVGRVVVVIIVDARFRPSSRASACKARTRGVGCG